MMFCLLTTAALLLMVPLASAFAPTTSLVRQACTLSSSSALNMGKKNNNGKRNSDRARVENNLEKMMDNDWREFRAKLVAQEQAESEQQKQAAKTSGPSSHHHHPQRPQQQQSSSQASQSRRFVPRPFPSATTPNRHPHQHHREQHHRQQPPQRRHAQQHHHERHRNHVDRSHHNRLSKKIFQGAAGPHESRGIGDAVLSDDTFALALSEDPFLSPDELPLLIPPSRTPTINKHRWAHALSHVETGAVLIANEKLHGVFHQTVVLIVRHCENRGTVGIVINRPMDGNLKQVASESDSNLDLSLKLAFSNAAVSYGGPVWEGDFSMIHGFGPVEGSTRVCPGVFIGGSLELQEQVRSKRFDPAKESLFCRGHAAWLPGQLQEEIQMGVWYTAAVSSDLILRHAGAPITDDDKYPTDLWAEILSTMGGPHAQVVQDLHQKEAAAAAVQQQQQQQQARATRPHRHQPEQQHQQPPNRRTGLRRYRGENDNNNNNFNNNNSNHGRLHP